MILERKSRNSGRFYIRRSKAPRSKQGARRVLRVPPEACGWRFLFRWQKEKEKNPHGQGILMKERRCQEDSDDSLGTCEEQKMP